MRPLETPPARCLEVERPVPRLDTLQGAAISVVVVVEERRMLESRGRGRGSRCGGQYVELTGEVGERVHARAGARCGLLDVLGAVVGSGGRA